MFAIDTISDDKINLRNFRGTLITIYNYLVITCRTISITDKFVV